MDSLTITNFLTEGTRLLQASQMPSEVQESNKSAHLTSAKRAYTLFIKLCITTAIDSLFTVL